MDVCGVVVVVVPLCALGERRGAVLARRRAMSDGRRVRGPLAYFVCVWCMLAGSDYDPDLTKYIDIAGEVLCIRDCDG